MRFRTFILAMFLVASSFVTPHAVHAASGIPFWGPIIPQGAFIPSNTVGPTSQSQATCPASWGMVIVVINNILKLLLSIVIVFIAPLSIAYAGFVLVVGQGNSGEITRARGILTHTIAGIVVSMSAWMIIAALLAVLMGGTNSPVENWTNLISSGGADPCLNVADSFSTAVAPSAQVPSGVVSGVAGNEQTVRDRLGQAHIEFNHEPCPPGSSGQGCTDVGGLRQATVDQIIAIRNACGGSCQIVVTGGSEPGHASGAYSHGNGYKVDLGLNSELNAFFLQKLTLTGLRGGDSGGPVYKDRCQNDYVKESDHWDITVLQPCNL